MSNWARRQLLKRHWEEIESIVTKHSHELAEYEAITTPPALLVTDMNVLSRMLSYTPVCDALRIGLTCKLWHAAIFVKGQPYWKKHVAAFLVAKGVPKNVAAQYDAFIFAESLRECVEWMFKRTWYRIGMVDKDGDICIERFSYKSQVRYDWFRSETGFPVLVSLHESKYVPQVSSDWESVDGRRESIIYFNGTNNVHRRMQYWARGTALNNHSLVQQRERGTPMILYLKNKSGDIYSGQAKYLHETGSSIIPHGDGEWLLADGTQIKGEGVAWNGEPRMNPKKK